MLKQKISYVNWNLVKDFSRLFYPPDYDFAIFVPKIYAWLATSPYERAKEFNGFQFYDFPFKTKNTNKYLYRDKLNPKFL